MIRKPWHQLSRSQQWRYGKKYKIGEAEHRALRQREAAYDRRMSAATKRKLRAQGVTRSDYVWARGVQGRPGSEKFSAGARATRNLRQTYKGSSAWPRIGGLTPDQQRRVAEASPDELKAMLRGEGRDRDIAEHLWYKGPGWAA